MRWETSSSFQLSSDFIRFSWSHWFTFPAQVDKVIAAISALCFPINCINRVQYFRKSVVSSRTGRWLWFRCSFLDFLKPYEDQLHQKRKSHRQRLSRYYLWSKFFNTLNTNIAQQGKALFMFFIPKDYAASNEANNIFGLVNLKS